mgnify:CR=1 FL=1
MASTKAGLRCDDKRRFSTYSQAWEEAASYTRRVALLLSPMVPYYCHNHEVYHIGHWRSWEERQSYNAMIKSLYRNGDTEQNEHLPQGWAGTVSKQVGQKRGLMKVQCMTKQQRRYCRRLRLKM